MGYRGLSSDFSYVDQPEGTIPFALNTVLRSGEGDLLELTNELGFQLCQVVTENYLPLGDVYVGDDTLVIFSADDEGHSEIGILNKFCEYKVFVNADCLGFDQCRQIDAKFRLRKGCERTVYFTDGKNVRSINIDDKNIADTIQDEGCNSIRLIPCFDPPCLDFKVRSGGRILAGSYDIYIAYSDFDGNATPFFPGSLPINIFDSFGFVGVTTEGNGFDVTPRQVSKRIEVTISGADHSFDFYQIGIVKYTSLIGEISEVVISPLQPITQSVFVYDGNESGYRSATIEELVAPRADIESADHIEIFENRLLLGGIRGIDIDLCKFQRMASKIQTFYSVKSVVKEEYENECNQNNALYLEFGSHPRDEVISVGIVYEIDCGAFTPVIPLIGPSKDVRLLSCNSITSPDDPVEPEECEQSLVLHGVGFDDNADDFQGADDILRYKFVWRVLDADGVQVQGNYKKFDDDPPKSFTTFRDTGFFERVFGPFPCDWTIEVFELTILEGSGYADWVIKKEEPDRTDGRGPDVYTGSKKDSQIISVWSNDIEHLVTEQEFNLEYGRTEADRDAGKRVIERWQVYNTAIRYNEAGGQPGYYECPTVYPEIETCDGKDYWGQDACGFDLTGTPIRHPRMPDARLEPLVGAGGVVTSNEYCLLATLPFAEKDATNQVLSPIDVTYTYSIDGVETIVTKQHRLSPRQTTDARIECFGDIQPTLDSFSAVIDTAGYESADPITGVIDLAQTSSRVDGEVIRLLQLTFRGVMYPEEIADRIVGHHFVIAKSDGQETVVDNGYMSKFTVDGDLEGFGWMAARDGDTNFFGSSLTGGSSHYAFMSDEVSYNQGLSSGDYVKFNTVYKVINNDGQFDWAENSGIFDTEVEWFIAAINSYYDRKGVSTELHMKMNNSLLMTPTQELVIGGQRLFNLSIDNTINFLDLARNYTPELTTGQPFNGFDRHYVTIKRNVDVYCNLDGLVYRRLHNCTKTGFTATVGGGSHFITPFRRTNTFLYTVKRGSLDNILRLIGSVIGFVIGLFTSPVLAIASIVSFGVEIYKIFLDKRFNDAERFDDIVSLDALDTFLDGHPYLRKRDIVAYVGESLEGLWSESRINTYLRQDAGIDCFSYNREGSHENFIAYLRTKMLVFDENERLYQLRPLPCVEWYGYSKDYSRLQCSNVYFPLPINHDCCSDCQNYFPHRIQWSNQSFQEETVDHFKVFLPNNFSEVNGEHGPITNLWTRGRELMTTTRETTLQQPASVQTLQTEGLIAYLGTGEFLSIAPVELIDSALGTAGSQDKWSFCKSSDGMFWVDTMDRKVWLFGNKLERISDYGEANWFDLHLKQHLICQIQDLHKVDYECDPAAGVGVICAYDSRFQRFIVTKRDFLMLPGTSYDPVTKTFVNENGDVVILGDPEFFENKSWTRSYYPSEQGWVGFHSYLPRFYITSKNNLYVGLDHHIWRFNQDGLHHNYFGVEHPHIIELVFNGNGVEEYQDVQFYSVARIWDPEAKDYVEIGDATFNKAVVYNSRQCSGLINLVVKETMNLLQRTTQVNNQVFIYRRDRDWSFNGMVDFVVNYDQPMFVRDWARIQDDYFIDKVVNDEVVDFSKDWLERASFKDKFLVVRLILDSRHDIKNTLYLGGSSKSKI